MADTVEGTEVSKEEVVDSKQTENTSNEDAPMTKEEFEHFKTDFFKLKEKNNTLLTEKQKLESDLKRTQEERMKKDQEWQKLAELKQQEADEYKQKLDGMNHAIVMDKKFSALKTAALQSGIRKEALDDLEMLSLDDIVIETTSTGRHNVLGVDQYLSKLKMTKPHWFASKGASVNANTPEVSAGGSVSYQDIRKAEDKARISGDWAPVKKLMQQYNAQRL